MRLPFAAGCCAAVLLLGGCGEYEERERETGYTGKARVNPWLAAERFAEKCGYTVESRSTWQAPDYHAAVWFAPASELANESYMRKADAWMLNGGHLILLLQHGGSDLSDWRSFWSDREPDPAVEKLLTRAGLTVTSADDKEKSWKTSEQTVKFAGREFKIDAGAGHLVGVKDGGSPGMMATTRYGQGRLTAVADARIFRNRWLDTRQHAALLEALIDAGTYEGGVRFDRAATLSLWEMITTHLWAILTGGAVLLVAWLWKNLARFGPLESAETPTRSRHYDRFLGMIAGFHWRTDRAAALLGPLRERILEHGLRHGQRTATGGGDFHQWLADRAGLPVERVSRALDPATPPDAASLIRLTGDLQHLLNSIRA